MKIINKVLVLLILSLVLLISLSTITYASLTEGGFPPDTDGPGTIIDTPDIFGNVIEEDPFADVPEISSQSVAQEESVNLWNGDGILPYMGYLDNSDEHINLYNRKLNVYLDVFTLKGRGLDLKLSRRFASNGVADGMEQFKITSNWYFDVLYYDSVNSTLHFPGGAIFTIPYVYSSTVYKVECGGRIVKVYRQTSGDGNIYQLEFEDGTVLRNYPAQNYQIIIDEKGNSIRYNFTQLSYKEGSITRYYYRIYSMVDSSGRFIIFNYYWVNHYPYINSAVYYCENTTKLIFERRASSTIEGFYDFLKRGTTNYRYTSYFNSATNRFEYYITDIYYPDGSHTDFDLTSSGTVTSQKYIYRGKSRLVTYSRQPLYTQLGGRDVYGTKVTIAGIKSTNYFFNSMGYLTEEDVYSTSGKLIKATRTNYNHTSWTYVSKINPYLTTTYYADVYRPNKVTVAFGTANGELGERAITSYVYDNWGNICKITDPYNTVTCIIYNNTNSYDLVNLNQYGFQPIKFQAHNYSHNKPNTKATMIIDNSVHFDRKLSQVHYLYNSVSDVMQESIYYASSGGATCLDTHYDYDYWNNLIYKKDANGNEIWYEYSRDYSNQYLTRIYNKNTGQTYARYQYYFDSGQPSSYTDAKGYNYTYTYDFYGRLKTETLNAPNAGYIKTIDYHDNENRIYLTFGDATNSQEGQIYYDELTGKPRLIQRKFNNELVTQIEKDFDSNGRLQWERDNLGHTTSYLYDAVDRVSQIQTPAGEITKFDWDDRKLTITDALQNKREEFYDVLNRLTKVWEHPDPNTTYETKHDYDTYNNLIQTTNPKGAKTAYSYDNLGRLTRLDYPQDGANPMASEIYTYDAVGNLRTKTQGQNSKTIDYEFFSGYRVSRVTTQPDGKLVSYTYDANDNILTQSAPGVTYTYSNHDARNRAHNFTAQMDGNTFYFSYNYDTFGRMTSITYPGRSNPVTYQYDELDRLQSIPGFVTSCSYDGDNKLTGMMYANGVNNTWTYDSNNDRLTNIGVGNQGSLLSLNYSYDPVGNIARINNDYYDYDGMNRLIWAGNNPLKDITSSGIKWGYDEIGNIKNKEQFIFGHSQGAITYVSDFANRLQSMGSINFKYNEIGERIEKNQEGSSWSYVYDSQSRLTQISKNSGLVEANTFDADGLRIKKVRDGKTVYTVYNGVNPIVEYTDGAFIYYIYAGNRMIAEQNQGTIKYYHKDHLGSVRLVTDSNGNKLMEYRYDPYGETHNKNENLIGSNTALGSFDSSPFKQSISIANIIKLEKNSPVIFSPQINLKPNTNYVVEFDYWSDADNITFGADLYPDDLPEILIIANRGIQHYRWELSSSSNHMANSYLRFWGGPNVYITNIKLSEMPNVVKGETEIGLFKSSPNKQGVDLKKIIKLLSSDSVIFSPQINLKPNTNYVVEFDYWSDADNITFGADLYPDDLPEVLIIAHRAIQHYRWELSSSSSNMANSYLRFWGGPGVYITNIRMYEYPNILLGNSEIGSMEQSPNMSQVDFITVNMPQTNKTVKAIKLTSGNSVIFSPQVNLKTYTNYVIEFDYWADSDNTQFRVDLYPDDLPEVLIIANRAVQHYKWELSSSSSNMANSYLSVFLWEECLYNEY